LSKSWKKEDEQAQKELKTAKKRTQKRRKERGQGTGPHTTFPGSSYVFQGEKNSKGKKEKPGTVLAPNIDVGSKNS